MQKDLSKRAKFFLYKKGNLGVKMLISDMKEYFQRSAPEKLNLKKCLLGTCNFLEKHFFDLIFLSVHFFLNSFSSKLSIKSGYFDTQRKYLFLNGTSDFFKT